MTFKIKQSSLFPTHSPQILSSASGLSTTRLCLKLQVCVPPLSLPSHPIHLHATLMIPGNVSWFLQWLWPTPRCPFPNRTLNFPVMLWNWVDLATTSPRRGTDWCEQRAQLSPPGFSSFGWAWDAGQAREMWQDVGGRPQGRECLQSSMKAAEMNPFSPAGWVRSACYCTCPSCSLLGSQSSISPTTDDQKHRKEPGPWGPC